MFVLMLCNHFYFSINSVQFMISSLMVNQFVLVCVSLCATLCIVLVVNCLFSDCETNIRLKAVSSLYRRGI